jgi:hypothetical protein
MMIFGAAMLIGTPPRRRSVSLRPSCAVSNLLAARVRVHVRVSECMRGRVRVSADMQPCLAPDMAGVVRRESTAAR